MGLDAVDALADPELLAQLLGGVERLVAVALERQRQQRHPLVRRGDAVRERDAVDGSDRRLDAARRPIALCMAESILDGAGGVE